MEILISQTNIVPAKNMVNELRVNVEADLSQTTRSGSNRF